MDAVTYTRAINSCQNLKGQSYLVSQLKAPPNTQMIYFFFIAAMNAQRTNISEMVFDLVVCGNRAVADIFTFSFRGEAKTLQKLRRMSCKTYAE